MGRASRMPTIRAVAERAQVSVGTVSNVLNRPSYVSPETRERVLDAMRELEFVPTEDRRRFRPGRERVLGCVVVDLANSFFVDVALGVEAEARRQGAGVVLCNSGDSVRHEEHNLDLLIQMRVHGIIVAPIEDSNPRLVALREKGIPLVFLDRQDPINELGSVRVDHVEGGRLAARHLLELGHRRLAVVGGPERSHLVQERLKGFREEAAGAGLPARDVELLEWGTWTEDGGERAARALLRRDPARRATGVFCCNDLIARGFIGTMADEGIQVPSDVSVVGYDDLDWAAHLATPLTTVQQPREQLGREATEMLMRAIDDPRAPVERRTLSPRLIVRSTTASP